MTSYQHQTTTVHTVKQQDNKQEQGAVGPIACFGIGSESKDKTQSKFGDVVQVRMTVSNNKDDVDVVMNNCGLLGMTSHDTWNDRSRGDNANDNIEVDLSLSEIVDEDCIRDLLAVDYDPQQNMATAPKPTNHQQECKMLTAPVQI